MKNREINIILKVFLIILAVALAALCLLSFFRGCAAEGWTPSVSERPAVLDAKPEVVSYPIETEERISILLPGENAQYELLTRAEEQIGIPAEYVLLPAERYGTEFALRLSGGTYCDLMYRNNNLGEFTLFPERNAAMDLTELVSQHAPNYLSALQRDPLLARCVFEGADPRLLSFYQLRSEPGLPEQGLFIRSDWLEQVGMDIPTTYEEYEVVLTAFRNQIGCEQPLALWHNGAFPGDLLAAGFGVTAFIEGTELAEMGFYVQDGAVKYGPAEPGFLDYLTLLHRWYELGFFTSDYVTWRKQDDYDRLILESQTGLFYTDHARGLGLVQNIHDGGTALPVPDPVQQSGDSHHLGSQRSGIATNAAFFIVEGCERAELCARWCDFWYSDEGAALLGEAIEPALCFDWTPVLPGIHDPVDIYRGADAATQQIWDSWSTQNDSAWRLSEDLTLSERDRHRMDIVLKDLNITIQSFTNRFILGEEDVSNYDAYLRQLEHCGLSHAIHCIESYLKTE